MQIKDAVKSIITQEGKSILEDNNRFLAMIDDLSPEARLERQVLRTALDSHILKLFLNTDERMFKFNLIKAEDEIRNKGISDNWIEFILELIGESVGWSGAVIDWKKNHQKSLNIYDKTNLENKEDKYTEIGTVISDEIRNLFKNAYNMVAAGANHVAIRNLDGTVTAYGQNNYGQCNTQHFIDIVQVSCGAGYTVGLKKDGSIMVTGGGLYGGEKLDNTKYWKDIVGVSAGIDHLIALRKNGKPFSCGYNGKGQCDVLPWNNIIDVTAGYWFSAGVRKDGTVIYIGKNNNINPIDVSQWTDIIQIEAGNAHIVGLKADGRVVASGHNDYGECNVGSWQDIVSINACMRHTVGIRMDGRVLVVGEEFDGMDEIREWKNVRYISLFSNPIGHGDVLTQAIAVTSDDRILYAGGYDYIKNQMKQRWNR